MVQFPLPGGGLAANPALLSGLDAQVGYLGTLSLHACDTMRRLGELNMQLSRQLVDDSIVACRDVLACDDPAQMAAVAMRRLQPSGERLLHYQRSLLGMVARTQGGLFPALPPTTRTPGGQE